ncbi:MAG: nitroreductase family protein [Acidimicrobiales bacterium]
MELREALRTTGAVRSFTDSPVPDATVAEILETARFAPSGGNRQGWRVVVVHDADIRRRLRALYLDGWYEYLAQGAAGLVPWAPITDREAERAAVAGAPALAEQAAAGPGGFAEHLERSPVLLLVLADLRVLAAVDRDLERYTFAGGASVYPFCWSILLAARAAGLGGVLTTMAVRSEPAVKALVGAPAELAVAGLIVLGHPVHRPSRLTRHPVEAFTTLDRLDGPAFGT